MVGLLKVSIQGSLPSGEVWSVNPCWALPTGVATLPFEDLNTIATAINNVTVPTDVRAMLSTSTNITGVRLEHRNEDGTLRAQLEQPRPTLLPGTGGGALPFQSACVVSLRGASSSAHSKGRLYWPATGATLISGSLRLNPSVIAAFLSGMKTYLSGITTAIQLIETDARLGVWSRSTSTVWVINRLQSGDIVDVQRRRRDSLTESFQLTAFP
jgi:hypothetical protein